MNQNPPGQCQPTRNLRNRIEKIDKQQIVEDIDKIFKDLDGHISY